MSQSDEEETTRDVVEKEKNQKTIIQRTQQETSTDEQVEKTKSENTKRKKSEVKNELGDSQVEDERLWQDAEKLLATKMMRGKKYYRVKWAGENIKPTWELGSDVSEALKIQFHTTRTLQGRRRKRKKIC